MNIGIIVYSQTGNTLSVAERVKDALNEKGHKAVIDKVTAEGEVGPGKPFAITSSPDAAKYDAIVIASPVMAFSLNPAMKAYLKQMQGIKGKKAACFVTQHFPANWMGGNKALKTMSSMLSAKGAQAFKGGIVHWKEEQKRSVQTGEVIAAICGQF